MGATSFEIHGDIGIDFTCHHIIDNIINGQKEKCERIEIEAFKSMQELDENPTEHFDISVCCKCFDEFNMKRKMKILLTRESIDQLFPMQPYCALCIKEYTEKNIIK